MADLSGKSVLKNYLFLGLMLAAIIAGCIVGAVWPGATVLAPLGAIFINLMLCLVVPLVFCSIAGAIASMGSQKRVGNIFGVSVIAFVVTSVIAAVLMIILMKIFPPVLTAKAFAAGDVEEQTSIGTLIVNFFTVNDFAKLLTRSNTLPLIVFAILFGFGTALAGGKNTMVAKFLDDMIAVMIKIVQIITYYAPIAFFGFFASLVAEYGPELIGDYSRAMAVYYPLCFIYLFTAFPLYAWFGGGKGAVKTMFKHLFRPAVTALGTCSSAATLPILMTASEETGISKDVTDMVFPLGLAIHKDGTVIGMVLKIAFVAGILGIPFAGFGMMIKVVAVSVIATVAISGIPGGGGIGEFILCAVFFPDQMAIAYPITLTISYLIDPPATMLNAAADYPTAFIVSRFADGKDWLQKVLAKKAA